jgi:hypothetical protein
LESNHLFDGSADYPVSCTSHPFEAIKARFFWSANDIVSPKLHIFDISLCQILRITTQQAMQLNAGNPPAADLAAATDQAAATVPRAPITAAVAKAKSEAGSKP